MKVEERFQDRVILGEDAQAIFVGCFLALYEGNYKRAAEEIGEISGQEISASALHAYLTYQNKSVAKFAFEVMARELMEKPNLSERTLKDIRGGYLKREWKKRRATMLRIAQEASKKGLRRVEQKYGRDWPDERMKIVRGYLEGKYGKGYPRIIGKQGIVKSREKYGDRLSEVISKATIEGFKKIYGEDWKESLWKRLRSGLERKFGEDWAEKVGRMGWNKLAEVYGQEGALKILEIARSESRKWFKRSLSEKCARLGLDYLKIRDFSRMLLTRYELSEELLGMPQKEALVYMRFIRKYLPEICSSMGYESAPVKTRLVCTPIDLVNNQYTLKIKRRRN